MSRLKTGPGELSLDDDDRAALELLRPGRLRSASGAPEEGAGRTVWDRDSTAEGYGLLEGRSPICEAALNVWNIATMKAPARGRLPRKALAWTWIVLAFDMSARGDYRLLEEYLSLAVAAGIGVESIEALRDGRLDALADDDRSFVEFIRAVSGGTVNDAIWSAEAALVGGDRGVVEHIHLILFTWGYVRIPQALGSGGGLTEERLDELLAALREGAGPPADIAAFERFYDSCPWPKPARR